MAGGCSGGLNPPFHIRGVKFETCASCIVKPSKEADTNGQ